MVVNFKVAWLDKCLLRIFQIHLAMPVKSVMGLAIQTLDKLVNKRRKKEGISMVVLIKPCLDKMEEACMVLRF